MISTFFYPLPSYNSPSTSNSTSTSTSTSTLILPSISLGSVPQLATDLIIHHKPLALRKVARLDSNLCWGFFGAEERDGEEDEEGCTALEVFQNKSGLTIIQQRSPVLKSCKDQFVQNLLSWIRKEDFQEVLILGSMDAGMRSDSEMETPLLHLLSSPTPSTPTLAKLSKTYPLFSPPTSKSTSTSSSQKISLPHLPSGGLTRRILSSISKSNRGGEKEINAGSILLFCAEGDNRMDAKALANVVLSLLEVEKNPVDLIEPPSWFTLFGGPADQSLYG